MTRSESKTSKKTPAPEKLADPQTLPGMFSAALLADLMVLMSRYGIGRALRVNDLAAADCVVQHLKALARLTSSQFSERLPADEREVVRESKHRRKK